MKSDPTTLFIYALSVTVLSMVSRDPRVLLALALLNLPLGTYLGRKRGVIFFLLYFLGLFGIFLNSVAFSNQGAAVLDVGPLVVREGAVKAFLRVFLRLSSILGAALIFYGLADIRELLDALECTMRIPRGFVFSLAVGLRMLALLQRDAGEILEMRAQRGHSRRPLTPGSLSSFLRTLLSVALERGLWIGVAAELRGLSLRERRPRPYRPGLGDVVLLALLALQLTITILSMVC